MTNLTIEPGNVLEKRVEVVSKISEGTSGIVYKGYHRHLDRVVAIKALHVSRLADRDSLIRFYREASVTSALDHANIVKVYGVGLAEEQRPYIVMEYIDGKTLSELVRGGELNSFSVFAAIIKQVCLALQHAHEQGIVHRDIKPSNVLVIQTEDTVTAKVVDFGIAREVAGERMPLDTITRDGMIIGTPAYMSPEQCLGRALDGRSDIYSLGCTMYYAITGQIPFESEAAGAVIHMHLTQEPAALATLTANFPYPAGLDAIVKLAMSKSPDERYQDIGEVLSDLDQVCSDRPPSIATARLRKVSTVKRPPVARKRQWATGVICIASILLAGTIIIFQFQKMIGGDTSSRKLLLEAKTLRDEAESAFRRNDFVKAEELCRAAEEDYRQVAGATETEAFGELCILRALAYKNVNDISKASFYAGEADTAYSNMLKSANTQSRKEHLNEVLGDLHQDWAHMLDDVRDYRAAALHYVLAKQHMMSVTSSMHEFRHGMRAWQGAVRCFRMSGQYQTAAREQKAFINYCTKLGANDPTLLAHQHREYAQLLELTGNKMLAQIEFQKSAKFEQLAAVGGQVGPAEQEAKIERQSQQRSQQIRSVAR